jgi:hypothetical protein
MDLSPSHQLFVWSKYKGANPTWLLILRSPGATVSRAVAAGQSMAVPCCAPRRRVWICAWRLVAGNL